MNKPELTNEVSTFLTAWEEYQKAIQGHRFTDLERYARNDYAGIISHNAEIMDENSEKMEAIRNLGYRLAAMGAEVMTAAQEYQTQLYNYNREQEQEANRPRNEWEAARREYADSLKSTIRSLSIKIGHAESKMYSLPYGEEKDAAAARLQSLRAEKQLADQLENALGFMRYTEGQTFTEQTVLDYMEARRESWAYVMEQLLGQPA